MSVKLCIRCNKKERVGYKYCEKCKKEAALESNRLRLRKIRAKTPCAECGISLCSTKYCMSCAQIVKKKHNKKYRNKVRTKSKPTNKYVHSSKIKIPEKFLVRGNIHTYSSSDNISNGA